MRTRLGEALRRLNASDRAFARAVLHGKSWREMGLMQVHVNKDGALRSVALMNLRIAEQGPVRILLRNVPPVSSDNRLPARKTATPTQEGDLAGGYATLSLCSDFN